MAQPSNIEWTEATWNPVRGCDKISPGCKHCYAETFAERFRGVKGHAYEQGFDLRLVPHKLADPLKEKKPTTYFVNSMSDLFHDGVPDEYIAQVFAVMAACPRHTFQVLTKRAARLPRWFAWAAEHEPACGAPVAMAFADLYVDFPGVDMRSVCTQWPLPNVWIGVSCEDREYGRPRLDHLRQVPAAVRFVSFEPLLEDLGRVDLTGIHWAIIGGESGNKARAFRPEWARSLLKQCRAQGVAPFVKQMGSRIVDRNDVGFDAETYTYAATGLPVFEQAWPTPRNIKHDIHGYRDEHQGADVLVQLRSRKGNDMAEWPADLRVREMPATAGGGN